MNRTVSGSDAGTVVVDPSIRIGLLRACAWLADRGDEEREAAAAGVRRIPDGRPVLAGCYPVALPLYLIAQDLDAAPEDLLLAATELVKLGHLDGRPDVPPILAHHVRITEAGREWLRAYDSRTPAEANAHPLPSSSPSKTRDDDQ